MRDLTYGDPPATSEHRFWLTDRSDEQTRMRLADDPNLPVAFLADLAIDECYDVRVCVSDNPSTPTAILELLAQDEHPDVRYAIAENANIPPHILRMLVQDENPYVSARACKTLSRLQEKTFAPLRGCA